LRLVYDRDLACELLGEGGGVIATYDDAAIYDHREAKVRGLVAGEEHSEERHLLPARFAPNRKEPDQCPLSPQLAERHKLAVDRRALEIRHGRSWREPGTRQELASRRESDAAGNQHHK